jgi:ribosomal protein S18 acetylase RimI-like enzyme
MLVKNMEIIKLENEYRKSVIQYVNHEWGNPIVTKGNIIDIYDLPGFVVLDNGEIAGAVLYQFRQGECEIVALYSLKENIGIGTMLINAVIQIAKENTCSRVWLITMNDNIHAIRYYQKRGFSLKAVHINAFKITQQIKGEISEAKDNLVLGIDDIPILHEFEFEIIC